MLALPPGQKEAEIEPLGDRLTEAVSLLFGISSRIGSNRASMLPNPIEGEGPGKMLGRANRGRDGVSRGSCQPAACPVARRADQSQSQQPSSVLPANQGLHS